MWPWMTKAATCKPSAREIPSAMRVRHPLFSCSVLLSGPFYQGHHLATVPVAPLVRLVPLAPVPLVPLVPLVTVPVAPNQIIAAVQDVP